VIHIFDKGHHADYSIGNFSIDETLKVDSLDKTDNYYFKISHEKFKMNFQVFKDYNKSEKVISKIRYYDAGEYKCILPIFKGGDILTDIMCVKDGNITYYHDLDNEKVDKFASSLKKDGYNKDDYKDKTTAKRLSNTQTLYEKNLIENHYLAMESYRGLTLVNSSVKTVKLFDNDVYKKPVSIFTDKYYIVADYNEEYTFKKFFVVNLINGNVKEIRSYNEISFDSVIEGVVGDDVYIFDKDAETQYKISLKYENVQKVASKDGIKYYNGKWTTMTLNEALDGKLFDNYYSSDIDGYDRVNKIGKDEGYYYLYKKEGDKYLVYRADIQNPKMKTYLFTTTDLQSVIYLNDYIYFKNGMTLYYYSSNGVRKVIENSELEFNTDISFGAYIK
jgi:hypothetical protein